MAEPEPAPEPPPIMAAPDDELKKKMISYQKIWDNLPVKGSQSEIYGVAVSDEPVDCTEMFTKHGLNKVFTCDGFSMEMKGPTYNCNLLGRQVGMTPDVLVFDDENYTVLHPLGKPGLALGADNAFKVAHMMIVAHNGIRTFNELLPSTPDEITNLGQRLALAVDVTDKMKDNVQLSECGSKVVAKAIAMEVPITTGIRDFVQIQISAMTDELRKGRPGYLLKDEEGNDFATDSEKITQKLTAAFTGNLVPKIYIQGPDKNTQALSHLHLFMIDTDPEVGIPEGITSAYHNVKDIYDIKMTNV